MTHPAHPNPHQSASRGEILVARVLAGQLVYPGAGIWGCAERAELEALVNRVYEPSRARSADVEISVALTIIIIILSIIIIIIITSSISMMIIIIIITSSLERERPPQLPQTPEPSNPQHRTQN